MLAVNHWNPFEELTTLTRDIDRLFGRTWGDQTGRQHTATWVPPVEIVSQQDAWRLRVGLPGVDPSQVQIELRGNTLTISGDRVATDAEHAGTFQSELAYGHFERTFTLPSAVNRDTISASYRHGMLELVLPLAENEKPRRIELGSGQLRDIEVRKLA